MFWIIMGIAVIVIAALVWLDRMLSEVAAEINRVDDDVDFYGEES